MSISRRKAGLSPSTARRGVPPLRPGTPTAAGGKSSRASTCCTSVRRKRLRHLLPAARLANSAGWIDLDPETLQHIRFENVFALGDAASTSNAKTAAAARKQAPVVAENVLAVLAGRELSAIYDGAH